MDTPPQLYGVYGHPIAHSLSPHMHNAAFRVRGWRHWYIPIDCRPQELEEKLEAFRAIGGRGANLTRPLKETVLPLLTSGSSWVARAGAANTIVWTPEGWQGDNTDCQALLGQLSPALPGAQALVLGAGGAARASVAVLRESGYGVTVASRRPTAWPDVQWMAWEERLAPASWDVVVNATPVGQSGEAQSAAWPMPVEHGTVVDWVYSPRRTPFLREAEQHPVAVVDGLTLLVEQARYAWRLWFGEVAPADPMWDATAPWQ